MMKSSLTALALALSLGIAGCTSTDVGSLPPQSKSDREAQIDQAATAVKLGHFDHAERLLADYLHRTDDGELVFKSLGVSSASKDVAVHTVAILLWDTGRDVTLSKFAKRYLKGYERDVTLCRVAERSAQYELAYNCWNSLGDIDRARRSVRTESALRILKD